MYMNDPEGKSIVSKKVLNKNQTVILPVSRFSGEHGYYQGRIMSDLQFSTSSACGLMHCICTIGPVPSYFLPFIAEGVHHFERLVIHSSSYSIKFLIGTAAVINCRWSTPEARQQTRYHRHHCSFHRYSFFISLNRDVIAIIFILISTVTVLLLSVITAFSPEQSRRLREPDFPLFLPGKKPSDHSTQTQYWSSHH